MGRKRGSRFRKASDAQEQLEQIELAQRRYLQGKSKKRIDSTQKSKQRLSNFFKRIRRRQEAADQFD